jgi:hypothetical protein
LVLSAFTSSFVIPLLYKNNDMTPCGPNEFYFLTSSQIFRVEDFEDFIEKNSVVIPCLPHHPPPSTIVIN